MIRYRLDELGCFQFEWLVQSLLKARIGPGIESWGGRGDHGRDAYCPGPLKFPDRSIETPGPFIFQVKFVENANAAGASPAKALLSSVQVESKRIKERIGKKVWTNTAHFILVTNAPVHPTLRKKLQTQLKGILPRAGVHVLAGSDVCDYLDDEPNLRRSFPQLLGLRDLSDLIKDALSRESLEKSRSAIESARQVAPVFVPTQAYQKAWKVLRKHHFAVLEGPPEMGKSAIAWIIALAQVSAGWQAIYCSDPDKFFSEYDSEKSQVFVADDAFGLTEYDPTRSQKWESHLSLVMRQLNKKHWLIWTSRKHILERALHTLDFRRDFPMFPSPGAVIVNAEELSIMEKALILYRHAKAANLPRNLCKVIRENAKEIVAHKCFTPERIRQLVEEVLPNLQGSVGKSDETLPKIREAIFESIRNPTRRIRTSFHALPPSHKWALIALLEVGTPEYVATAAESYNSLCPETEHESFEDVLDQLREAFIKINGLRGKGEDARTLTWIHPSYRDLVIDELSKGQVVSSRFLSKASLQGVKLALSSGGGSQGKLELPLMAASASWAILKKRCHELAEKVDRSQLSDLLRVLTSASGQSIDSNVSKYIDDILTDVCHLAKSRWDSDEEVLNPGDIDAYSAASTLLSPLPPPPALAATWQFVSEGFVERVKDCQDRNYLDVYEIEEFVLVAKSVKKIEPRMLRQVEFEENYGPQLELVLELAEEEAQSDLGSNDSDELNSEASRLGTMSEIVSGVAELLPNLESRARKAQDKLSNKADMASIRAAEAGEPDPDYFEDTKDGDDRLETFSVDSLFSDL
jgi:hypothetical protein